MANSQAKMGEKNEDDALTNENADGEETATYSSVFGDNEAFVTEVSKNKILCI